MDADRRSQLEQRTRYDAAEIEGRVFASWIEAGYFHPEPEGTAAENYSIAIPPPNVTGSLHMGHALNGTIQDAMARKRRMEGRRVKWILGTDHAGIATQSVVEKELLKARASRATTSAARHSSRRSGSGAAEYGATIIEQFKRLGASCDYEDERFTLDEGYVKAVYRVFKQLFDKGLIYRDYYMVNWDPGSRSAISDLEVETREVTDTLYSIDYPVEGSDRVLTVATVRPETMLADSAVAVNPEGRALRRPDRELLRAAAGRPPAADHRRRLRRHRLRHRRAEDHAGPRPQRLRDRPCPRARGDLGDRRRRPHRRAGAGALRRPDRRRGTGGRRRRAARGRPALGRGALRRTRSRSRIAPASGSSR